MSSPRPIQLERTFSASLAEVWALWTTPDGIGSWWGPEGFTVQVDAIDLRVGGKLRYTMRATGAPQIAFMERAGMPLSSQHLITYTEVVPEQRLAYVHLVDFVPGHASYDVNTLVTLEAQGDRVLMRLRVDPMHDDVWTQRATMGWDSELDKLGAVLAARADAQRVG